MTTTTRFLDSVLLRRQVCALGVGPAVGSGCRFPLARLAAAIMLIAMVLGLLAPVGPAHAAVLTWTGGGADNNFTNADNWGDTTLQSGDSVVFDGSTRTTPNNNTGGGNYTLNGITFAAGANPFTVGGGWTRLTGNIVNNSTNTQTNNLGHEFHNSVQIHATAGPLVFGGGATFNLNGRGLTVTGPFDTTINIPVNGGGTASTLTKNGAGTLTLGATSSGFQGNLTVNQGRVNVNRLANLATRTITVDSGTLAFRMHDAFGNAGTNVVAPIVVRNGGTVTAEGAFTTLGPLTLNGGTLTGTGGASATYQMYSLLYPVTVGGTSPSTISGPAAGSPAFGGIHLGRSADRNVTFDVADVTGDAQADLTVSAVLIDRNTGQGGGSGGLIKAGAGTMVLTAANTYTGGTTLSQGILRTTHTAGFGTGPVTMGDANTGAANVQLTLAADNIANPITVSNQGTGTATLYGETQYHGHSGTITLDRDAVFAIPNHGAGADWWYSFGGGGISGPGAAIIRGGAGGSSAAAAGNRVWFSGNNSYSGGTVVESGMLQLGQVNAAGTGDITLGSANTGTAVTQLRLGANIGNTIVVSASAPGSAAAIGTHNALQVLGGALQVDRPLTINGASDRLTWSGANAVWSGSGDITIATGAGQSRVTHEGVANTWTGNMTVNSGAIFQPGHASTLTAANSVTVNGILQLNSVPQTIDGLSGTGFVQNIVGSNTLTVGAGGATSTFAGAIRNNVGTMSLTKTGAGTLTLSGANTYTGATTVTDGTLAVAAGGSLVGTNLVNPISGGTLTISGALTVADNGAFAVGNGTAGLGTVNIEAGAVVNIGNGAGGNAGRTYIGGRLDGAGSLGTGTLNINGGVLNVAAGGTGVTGDASNFWMNAWGSGGTSTLNLNGGTLSTARSIRDGGGGGSVVNFNGGTLRAAAGIDLLVNTISTASVHAGGLIVDSQNFNATISKGLSNGSGSPDGGLTKLGGGTLTLTGASTFTGNIVVNDGTLVTNVAANNANPTATGLGNMTVANRTVTVESGATLTFNASDALGSYQYKTPVTMVADGGTIQNGAGRFLAIGDIELKNGGTLNTQNGANAAYQTFNLRGSISVSGTSGSFITTTGSSLNGIHLGGSTIPATTFHVASTGDPTADLTVSVPLLNEVYTTGGLIKAGPGTMLLTAANAYTGGTTVAAGTLHVTGSLVNNSSQYVRVASAGEVFGAGDPTIVRRVAAAGSFAGLGSQIAGPGTLNTTADVRAGTNQSSGPLDVGMAWRTVSAAETAAFPPLTNMLSDVLQLSGMDMGGDGRTDPFVLEMSYDASLVQPYHTPIFLAWLNQGEWVNAVYGNSGLGGLAEAEFAGSWDDFVTATGLDPLADLPDYLGSWGIDPAGATAWAVLNHNSQFAVLAIPEPAAWLLLLSALACGLLVRRRRR